MAAAISVSVISARFPHPPGVDAGIRDAVAQWAPATNAFLRDAGIDSASPESILVRVRDGSRPAWTRGHQVTLYRRPTVAATVAPLAHELVHVLAPHFNVPALDEGLAVHADSSLCLAGPVWPFYLLPPDRWVAGFAENGTLLPLTMLLGQSRSPAAREASWPLLHRFYLQAASFVRFLLRQDGTAWQAWVAGGAPSTPAVSAATAATWLAQVGPPLSDAERRLRARSMDEQRRSWRDIRRDERPGLEAASMGLESR